MARALTAISSRRRSRRSADLLPGGLTYRLLNGNTPLTEGRATALAQAALDGLLR
jgi:hypothetical protein